MGVDQHVLLSYMRGGKDMKLHGVYNTEAEALREWDAHDTVAMGITPRRWFSVRKPDDVDDLVARAMASYRLTARQESMLIALLSAERDPRGGAKAWAIYNAKRRDMESFFVPDIYKQLLKKGLVNAHGVKYGAKRYYLTKSGKAVAFLLNHNLATTKEAAA